MKTLSYIGRFLLAEVIFLVGVGAIMIFAVGFYTTGNPDPTPFTIGAFGWLLFASFIATLSREKGKQFVSFFVIAMCLFALNVLPLYWIERNECMGINVELSALSDGFQTQSVDCSFLQVVNHWL